MGHQRRTYLSAIAGALSFAIREPDNLQEHTINTDQSKKPRSTTRDRPNHPPPQPINPFYIPTHPRYGAVGDGETDDSEAIQNAVDDASEANATVYIPPGSYYLQRGIDVTDGNVALEGPATLGAELIAGAEMNQSIIDGLDSSGESTEASNVSIRNLVLNGKGGWINHSYRPAHKAIRTKKGKNWTISNCYIHDSRATGVGLDSVYNDKYINNVLERCGTSGETTGSNGLGIGVGEVKGRCPTYAFGNTIIDTSQHAIILEQTGGHVDTKDAIFIGNIINGARGGIVGELADRITCIGNTTTNTREYGIYFGPLDSSKGCRFVTVMGNVVRYHGRGKYKQPYGLLVSESTDYAWALGNIIAESGVRVNAALSMMNSTGREAAGIGNKPTRREWNPHFRGGFVENTSDGTLWHLRSDGVFKNVY